MSREDEIRQRLMARFQSVAAERLQRLHHAVAQAERGAADEGLVAGAMREIHTLKGESKMMGLEVANQVAHATEEVLGRVIGAGQGAPGVERELCVRGLDLLHLLLVERKPADADAVELCATVAELCEGAPRPVHVPASRAEPPPRASHRRGVARVAFEQLDQLGSVAADLLASHMGHEHTHRRLATIDRSLGLMEEEAAELELGPAACGRLSALRRQLSQALAAWRDALFQERGQLRLLGDSVQELRLVPVASLLERYPSEVRRLAREQQKEVRVAVEADGIVVDHRVVDDLGEPLLHLARNVVDHGIELPAEREAQGKPRAAEVKLSARRLGGTLEIEVRDDGRGVDVGKVVATAVERGLVSRQEADRLEPGDAQQLVFLQGLSTRAEVSDVSGRGIGLCAVKLAVERLGGWVRVESRDGLGACFRLRVPVFVALVNVLVLDGGKAWFAIPSLAVHRVVMARADQLKRAGEAQVLDAEELMCPVGSLGSILGMDLPDPTIDGAEPIVVVSHQGSLVGLSGLRPLGERAAVRRPLDPFVEAAEVVTGTSVLDTGELCYLLNVPEVVRLALESAPARRGQAAPTLELARVLIVDDSDLTREMLVSLTQGLGYRTSEAVDGRDALGRLAAEPPDLVLTDLDMPVMDGFTLVGEIRANPATKDIPVVVLSTRGSDEDKRRAMQAGADSYLVKSSFDEVELRTMIDTYLAHPRATP